MKVLAEYIGLQERINNSPLILVNIRRNHKVDTEVYNPEIHMISKEDKEQITKDMEN